MTDSKKIDDGGPDLSALIEKLEKAEGPDRELDCQIAFATGHFDTKLGYGLEGSWIERGSKRDDEWVDVHVRNKGTLIYSERYPTYTSSIDSAVSLAERVLPSLSKIQPETYVGGEYHHCEIETEEGDFEAHNCPNVAMAICLATLRALQSRGEA